MGERDCSVQRRHQKLIEESPSPFLTPDLRKKMGKAATYAPRHPLEYQNAGTIEFLVDPKGRYYFIEMNTRIQVEHPVTEEVTGIDLIKQQICIANGDKLDFDQSDIKPRQACHQKCRINAEDPTLQFCPPRPARSASTIRPAAMECGWTATPTAGIPSRLTTTR